MKIEVQKARDFLEGKIEGLSNMKKYVLEVFDKHENFTKEEIKKYIEENL